MSTFMKHVKSILEKKYETVLMRPDISDSVLSVKKSIWNTRIS